MSATMTRQGGRVQLEQSDMHLDLNMANMAKGGFSQRVIEETRHPIKNFHAKVSEERKRGDEFPGDGKMKAAIERHPAMLLENDTNGCLPSKNDTAKNLLTYWWHK